MRRRRGEGNKKKNTSVSQQVWPAMAHESEGCRQGRGGIRGLRRGAKVLRKRRDNSSHADIPYRVWSTEYSGGFLVGSTSHGNSSRQRSDTDDDAGK